MKTKVRMLQLVVAMAAAVCLAGRAYAQPTNTPRGIQLDPTTGMPAGPGLGSIDPLTGFPRNNDRALPVNERLRHSQHDVPSNPTPPAEDRQPNQDGGLALLLQAQTLNANGQYDEALQCFLKLDAQAEASTNGVLLETALPDWAELGEKYPKAKQALVDIRDQGARQCSQGKGDLRLFQKVVDINAALGDRDATYALFKRVEQNNPSTADDYYFFMEPILVQHGEYQLCLKYIGNPEARFSVYRTTFEMERWSFKRAADENKETRQRMAEFNRQPGRPAPPPDKLDAVEHGSEIALKTVNDLFVGNVSRLIEILVATGHKEVAEKIRDQAVAVLDDPRLKSAVSDAEEKIQKRLISTGIH